MVVTGTQGDDVLNGTSSADVMSGGDGDDKLSGGAGADTLSGGSGDDLLNGGAGDDTLDGGTGSDRIIGGGGNDFAIWRYSDWQPGTVDYYDGGGNSDLLELQFSEQVWLYNPEVRSEILRFLKFMETQAGPNSDGHLFSFECFGLQVRNWENVQIRVGGAIIDPRAPYAMNDSFEIGEDGELLVDPAGVLANDADLDSDAIRVSQVNVAGEADPGARTLANTVTLDSGAQLTINPDGSVSFDARGQYDHLAVGQWVKETVTYTVTDGTRSDTATVTITITGTNDGPVATPDLAGGGENETLAIDVLANDTDADDGAVLTLVSASAPEGKGSASVLGNQLAFDPGADFDHLAAGATETVTLSYTIQDQHGATSSATVTVTVTGTNDAPVAAVDTASGTENETLAIDVLANDTDADDGAVLTLVSASAPEGKGTASVLGNQLAFDPGADFDHLAAGATETVTLSYTIQDQHGAISSATVTVTVTGTNDGPVIVPETTTASALVTEIADGEPGENSSTHTKTGTIDFADPDLTDIHSAEFVPQGSNYLGSFSLGSVDQSLDGVGWTFSVADSDLDALAVGEILTQTYTVTISDGQGGSITQDVTITIEGANDAPVITSSAQSGGVAEDADTTPSTNDALVASGTVSFEDADLADTHGASFLAAGTNTTALGVFALAAVDEAADATSGSVGWTYTLNSGLAQYLAEGETVTERYVVSISDGQDGTSQQEVAITITGSNDAPTIVAAGTTASGGVVELADNAPGENTAIHTAGGVIAFADVDLIDVHSAAVTALGSGYLGTLTLAAVDQGANSVGWTFTVSDAALNSLAAGQVATQTYRVEISDGQGGTVTQDVTVTLTGASDASVNLAPTDLGLIANEDVTKAGATIGTLYTIDPNAGDTFTYTLLSDPSQKFTIVGNQLKLVSGASLDFQGGNVTVQTYSLTIRTVDQGGLSYDEIINIVKGTNSQDTLTSQGGDDVIYGDGAKDIVHAAGGNDYIFGQNGDDELFGEDGNDVLNGENNVDKLFGGAGNDTLNGGAGSDTLTGEAGDDVFLFRKGEGNGDRVVDFTGANVAGGDILRLEGYGAGATLTHVSGEDWKITYSGGFEIIKLTGVTALNSGDYLFV